MSEGICSVEVQSTNDLRDFKVPLGSEKYFLPNELLNLKKMLKY
jgi:hypothetical protein